jgi:hypothetical protein
MQPELYFSEQWLRERHANIRADVRAARLRPQLACAAREVDPNLVKKIQVASIEEHDAVPVWKDSPHFLTLGATSFGGLAMWG